MATPRFCPISLHLSKAPPRIATLLSPRGQGFPSISAPFLSSLQSLMQTVLALPVQHAQKMRYSAAAVMPAVPNSPTPTLSSPTSPSTCSTTSDNAASSFTTSLDTHLNSNPALKINLPCGSAVAKSSYRIVSASKSKRTERRDYSVPFQYTYPTFHPTPEQSSASPSSDPEEEIKRFIMGRTPPMHFQFAIGALGQDNPELQCNIPDGLLPMPDSGTSSGPGPERHPKSRLARLFIEYPQLAHPYARLSQKDKDTKRRKIWNHTLEKDLFTPEELSTVNAPTRRQTYIPSLEAHIDRIHAKLAENKGWYPVPQADLEVFIGLNSKTAKSMVSGLQCDAIICNLKLLELRRINKSLEEMLMKDDPFEALFPHETPVTEFM